ncbi:MAG: sorbosone dehydrogenase family protein, partial [Porphyrobacter sp.]|nr:sorbosone dehydrogenase family protein [Porphyrobacter sp.]
MAIFRKIAITLGVLLVIGAGTLWYLGRGDTAALSVEEVTGTDPVLKEGEAQTVPTVQIAQPVGWGANEAPVPAEGLEVMRFAEGLEHPRTLFALPNGDILVSLTRAPKVDNPDAGIMDSIKGWIAGMLLSKAGATGESPNQIVLLR